MHGRDRGHERPIEITRRELLPDLLLHVQDVLARAERVRLEVRAGAVRVARLHPAQGDTVRLAGDRALDEIIRPRRLGRLRGHLIALDLGPLLALGEGLAAKGLVVENLDRALLFGNFRQAEFRLRVQHVCEHGPDVDAHATAAGAAQVETILRVGHRRDGDGERLEPRGRGELDPQQVVAEPDVPGLDLVEAPSLGQELAAVGSEQPGGFNRRQPCQAVLDRARRLGLRDPCRGHVRLRA